MNIIDKVRKLFAMAKDASSPNEAAIAARQARALMDKHQLSELDLTVTEASQFGHEDFGETKTVPDWVSVLGLAVGRLNDCRSIIIRVGDRKVIRFKGFLTDAVCAAEMMKYLQATAMRLAKSVDGRAERNTYRRGFASGVRRQIDEILREREHIKTSSGTALVVAKQALVTEQFGRQQVSRRRVNLSGSSFAYQRGVEAGKNVSLNRQVNRSVGGYLQ